MQQNAAPCLFNFSTSWVILNPIEQSIKAKIEKVGTPLKDWDVSINYGIKTGFNDAFIISEKERAEIFANCTDSVERKLTDELIRPILRGRDIKRYSYEWAKLYIIATFPSLSIDIDKFPALKKHLLAFGMERLEQTGKSYTLNREKIAARKKTNNKWFETQDQISYWKELSKQKIIWSDISDSPKFALDTDGVFYCTNTTYFMTGRALDYIFCYLNSPLSEHLFSKIGSSTGVGTTRWQSFTIEKLLVPHITPKEEQEFARLHSLLKQGRVKISDINHRIYTLCDLSEKEINFIENSAQSI